MDAIVTQVITHSRRVKLCNAASGARASIPAVTHIAFGTGGCDDNGNPIAADELQTELHAEIARYPIDSITYPADTTARYTVTIPSNVLDGQSISEAALVDAENDFAAIKNMRPKVKENGTEFIFEFEDRF